MFNSVVFNSAIVVVDDCFSKVELGCNVFEGRFPMVCKMVERKVDSIIDDLWGACRLGLVSEDETRGTIDEIKSYINSFRRAYAVAYEKVVGEDEYEIQWLMYHNHLDRQMAIKYFIEWNS